MKVVAAITVRAGRRLKGRRGIAVMIVLAAMVFLAATIVGMTNLFAHQARRTRAALAEVQLRQLLLAGTTVAREELRNKGTAERDVLLATPVADAAVHLHIGGTAANATVRIAGTWRGFKASQDVVFARDASGQWMLHDARLDQTGEQ